MARTSLPAMLVVAVVGVTLGSLTERARHLCLYQLVTQYRPVLAYAVEGHEGVKHKRPSELLPTVHDLCWTKRIRHRDSGK